MGAAVIDILYEDNHLLAVNKPAGLLVQGDRSGDETLLDRARAPGMANRAGSTWGWCTGWTVR